MIEVRQLHSAMSVRGSSRWSRNSAGGSHTEGRLPRRDRVANPVILDHRPDQRITVFRVATLVGKEDTLGVVHHTPQSCRQFI